MLQHKIAVARGGGTAIGKASGLQLAKNRAKVAMASRIVFSRSAATEFAGVGLTILPTPMEARKKDDIHILVNNVGISGLSLIDAEGKQLWLRQ